MDDRRFHSALERIEAANSLDPNREILNGEDLPKEVAYGRRMARWIDRLEPGASEPLRLAALCQHLKRWEVPRSSFPVGRAGYLRWRRRMGDYHAERAAEILRQVGYGEETIARVGALVRKEGLRIDPETQTLEDAACLVFLEEYFAEFARRQEKDKLDEIVRRVWRKMSERGRAEALRLPMSPETREQITRALAGERGEEPGGG
jgi:hypothetical protein